MELLNSREANQQHNDIGMCPAYEGSVLLDREQQRLEGFTGSGGEHLWFESSCISNYSSVTVRCFGKGSIILFESYVVLAV